MSSILPVSISFLLVQRRKETEKESLGTWVEWRPWGKDEWFLFAQWEVISAKRPDHVIGQLHFFCCSLHNIQHYVNISMSRSLSPIRPVLVLCFGVECFLVPLLPRNDSKIADKVPRRNFFLVMIDGGNAEDNLRAVESGEIWACRLCAVMDLTPRTWRLCVQMPLFGLQNKLTAQCYLSHLTPYWLQRAAQKPIITHSCYKSLWIVTVGPFYQLPNNVQSACQVVETGLTL